MRNGIVVLCLIILAAAALTPFMEGLIGAVGGLVVAPLAVVGSLLLTGFILAIVFTSISVVLLGVLGLVGVILLFPVIPVLFPLLIVIVPVVLLLKLIFRM